MSTYRSAAEQRRDQRTADDFAKSQMPCTFCLAPTDSDTLNVYGARCFACYRSYCEQARWFPSLTIAERRAAAARVKTALSGGLRLSGREHVAELQRRADAGEKMTAGQVGFLAAARGFFIGPEASEPSPPPRAETMDEPPAWATEA